MIILNFTSRVLLSLNSNGSPKQLKIILKHPNTLEDQHNKPPTRTYGVASWRRNGLVEATREIVAIEIIG
jgi:hypothetical protein